MDWKSCIVTKGFEDLGSVDLQCSWQYVGVLGVVYSKWVPQNGQWELLYESEIEDWDTKISIFHFHNVYFDQIGPNSTFCMLNVTKIDLTTKEWQGLNFRSFVVN